ncbi:alpha/beta hydrolase [Streptomyces sp. NBC_01485]|uniref:alpha/beta hydrolase fold domain-containing protein n=1 Tax=Streptomyces sp. NBC_01485 TaxID=2903884 RepID=UPI002E32D75F|nr:alpha/beta hydrolase fold domain-containing protein [Streptomyces sp. NBC_01485]
MTRMASRAHRSAVRTVDRTVKGRGGEIPIREYLPQDARDGAVPLLWIHGGGWMNGGLDQKESHAVAKAIAGTGRPVRTVDYRLAPALRWREIGGSSRLVLQPSENRYPAAPDDVLSVIVDWAASGAGRLFVGGASAGANLAVTAAVALRQETGVQPCGLALVYGGFHATLPPIPESVSSRLTGIAGKIAFTPASYDRMTLNYVGDEGLFPRAFPTGADLAGLPATLVMDADRDSLRASGARFASELRAAGSAVDYAIVENTWHGFLSHPHGRGFRRGTRAMSQWLDAHDLST